MAELTGPMNCAECGTDTSIEVYEAGDCDQLVIAFGGELVEIPGLVICTNCAGAVMVGERESTVTPERAVEFLTSVYAPILASVMTEYHNQFTVAYNRFADLKETAEKLDPNCEILLGMIDLG